MTVRKLYIYPDIQLKRSLSVSEVTIENLKSDVKDLIDTLKHYEGNSFLTANQIGLNKRLAVIDLQVVFQKEFKDEERFLVVVNPEIVSLSDEKININETSMSTPDFQCVTNKSISATVKFDKIILKMSTTENVIDDNQNKLDTVEVVNQKFDFDSFEFEQSIVTFWERLSFIMQAVIDQLNGKCYLDTISWYNRQSFIKKRQKKVKEFQKWVKSNLMNELQHRKLKNAR